MRRLLASVALSALFIAGAADAATHTLSLTADFGDLTTDAFVVGDQQYNTGQLQLTGFDAFTIEDGDIIEATVTITGGPFFIAAHETVFIGLDFFNFAGTDPVGDPGEAPLSPQLNGFFQFDGGLPDPAGCSNCLHFITGTSDNVDISFSTVFAQGTVSFLAEPYSVDRIQLSYQANSTLAVPEPSAWALMIAGFGGVGAMLRRRRERACAAA